MGSDAIWSTSAPQTPDLDPRSHLEDSVSKAGALTVNVESGLEGAVALSARPTCPTWKRWTRIRSHGRVRQMQPRPAWRAESRYRARNSAVRG